MLGVTAGTHLSEFRGRRLDRAELLTSIAWRVVDLLYTRLAKVPDRHRPHYSPAARFEILEIRNLLGWNQHRAATQFLVSDNTISNWERDQSPESKTVGSLAQPIPPVTRLSDATRHLVQMMARFAAADNIRATAQLERFWKSLKRIAQIRPMPPLDLPDLEQRLRHALAYYALNRPHSSLANRTPMQAFLGADPRALLGLPRGGKREPSSPPPLLIGFVWSSCGDLGVLMPAAA